MTNNTPSLRKLEFPAILDRLAGLCQFSLGAEHARALGPVSEPARVSYLLDVTSEAISLLIDLPDLTIGGARDIRAQVERAEKGGRLQPADLLLVGDTLYSINAFRGRIARIV
ncbi:MAG TPA: hypothetical protein PK819_02315, partial [Thermomicrobiales bacterium]|nr:hypothetical protein [Thermomicrobiales bacterium]